MPDTAMESEDEAFRFMENSDRRLFQVIQGYLGIVRTTAQTDDKIFFVLRSTVPFVFRKTNLPVEYELVGEAYVQGAMYSEMWREGLQPEWLFMTLVWLTPKGLDNSPTE